MNIRVVIKSNISGNVVKTEVSPRTLLNAVDESALINELTACNCNPVGETFFVECSCDEEWEDAELYLDEEIR